MRNLIKALQQCRFGAGPMLAVTALSLLSACGSQSSSNSESSSNDVAESIEPESVEINASDEKVTTPSLASLPAPFNEANFGNGQIKYSQCITCHTLAEGENGLGPSLHNIMNSPAGGVQGFNYSDVLQGSNLTWDAQTLDKWIENPAKLLPGSKMNYAGLRNADDRRDLIAYLMVETAEK